MGEKSEVVVVIPEFGVILRSLLKGDSNETLNFFAFTDEYPGPLIAKDFRNIWRNQKFKEFKSIIHSEGIWILEVNSKKFIVYTKGIHKYQCQELLISNISDLEIVDQSFLIINSLSLEHQRPSLMILELNNKSHPFILISYQLENSF